MSIKTLDELFKIYPTIEKLKFQNELHVDVASIIFRYNNINTYDDIIKNFKDINCLTGNFNDFWFSDILEVLSPLKKENDFMQFIEENKNKKFCVIGDYDCDGIMATIIMTYGLILYEGCDVTFTVPDRFDDGYGMHKRQVDIAYDNGAEVIITVDNGITANEVIDYAHEKNILVCVTDHHLPQGESHADLVIDPYYNDDEFQDISGATVAFKLIKNIFVNKYAPEHHDFNSDTIRDMMCLAAITVFSDVMPLLGENRYIAAAGIRTMNILVNNRGSFINKLATLVNFYDGGNSNPIFAGDGVHVFKKFTKDNIDFYFVPVINACNRVLGDVNGLIYDIMNLFVFDGDPESTYYADINKKRKFMKTELTKKHIPNDKSAVVEVLTPDYWDDNYSGIVGLVASGIVESEKKPAIIGTIDQNDDYIHFSGRSVSGFNLYNALTEIAAEHPELKFTFGGHAEALGVQCLKSDTETINKLEDYLSEKFASANIVEEIIDDLIIDIGEDSFTTEFRCEDLIDVYHALSPFGNKFVFPKILVKSKLSTANKYIQNGYGSFRIFPRSNLTQKVVYFGKQISDFINSNPDDYEYTITASLIEDKDGISLKVIDLQ